MGDRDIDPTELASVAEVGGAEPTEFAGVAEYPTDSSFAWSDDLGVDDAPTQRLTPRRITTMAVAASLAAVAVAGASAWIYLRDDGGLAPAATVQSPTPVPSAPPTLSTIPVTPAAQPELEGVDREFIAEMRSYGVPASDVDPWWTINLAHALCDTVHDGGPDRYPPGTNMLIRLTEGVRTNNPDWTQRQASRLVHGSVDYYCPDVRGPSQDEIAKLPSDARYLAILQDRIGLTPVDNSLIQAAYEVCNRKAQGWLTSNVVDAINSKNSRDDDQVMVETAIDVYCPEYR